MRWSVGVMILARQMPFEHNGFGKDNEWVDKNEDVEIVVELNTMKNLPK
jgi:hypothetical protein